MSKRSDTTDAECAPSARGADSCDISIVDTAAVDRAMRSMVGRGDADRTTAIFSALADQTRLRILYALSAEELCVCDLAAVAGVSQSGVSHQLRILRDRGLVTFRRDGLRAVYSLADEHVLDLIRIGLEHAREGARP